MAKVWVLLLQYPNHKTERWKYLAVFSDAETAKRVAVENDFPVGEVEWEFQTNRGQGGAWYTEFDSKPLHSVSRVRYLVLPDEIDMYAK